MKRRPTMLALAAVLSALSTAAALSPTAQIIATQGPVHRQAAGFGSRQTLGALPESFGEGQSLTSGQNGRAEILLRDASKLRLGPGSLLLLQEERPGKTVFLLQSGSLLASVAGRPRRRFSVVTPSAIIEVTGTVFSVEVVAPDMTFVNVGQGRVSVQGRWRGKPVGVPATLSAGQSVAVLNGAVAAPRDFPLPAPAPALSGDLIDREIDDWLKLK